MLDVACLAVPEEYRYEKDRLCNEIILPSRVGPQGALDVFIEGLVQSGEGKNNLTELSLPEKKNSQYDAHSRNANENGAF